MSPTVQHLTKTTIQGVLAFLVTLTACLGFLVSRIDGPTFMVITVLAFGWAFRQPGGDGK